MTSKAVRVRVEGRVQGVFYRASTQSEALDRGLAGWIRNLPDGAVEMFVQGPPDAVDELLAWARKGPPGARVTALDAVECASRPDLASFEISR